MKLLLSLICCMISFSFYIRGERSVVNEYIDPEFLDSLLSINRKNFNVIDSIIRSNYDDMSNSDLVIWGSQEPEPLGTSYVVIVCDSTYSTLKFTKDNNGWTFKKVNPADRSIYPDGHVPADVYDLDNAPPNKIKFPENISSYVPGPEGLFDLKFRYFAIKYCNGDKIDFITKAIPEPSLFPWKLSLYFGFLMEYN